jgi:hypothetical protein
VVKIEENEIYICANSNDALNRPLSSYDYASLRVIHIEGVRYDTRYQIDCFESLYSPPILAPVQPDGDTVMPGENTAPPSNQPSSPLHESGTLSPNLGNDPPPTN